MAQRTLSGNIALSKLKHVKMTCKGQNGPVEGIFIPIAANKLTHYDTKEGERVITMPLRVIVKDEADSNGQHGFVAKSIDKKDYEGLGQDKTERNENAKEFTPILGSLRDFSKNSESNEASGNAGGDNTFEPTDDLPF